ncbi:MAG: XRE family transcriptional regulator [Elusimicrobiota bacterium]|nr:XRE family transcriptional regulator [Elusimicrobiota bacterium]
MNASTLSTLMKARNLSQSDLARRAGVTRQAASLWFRSDDPDQVNVQSRHLEKLSRALSVSMDELARPLPALGDDAAKSLLETALLWDRLFPSLDDLAISAARGEERALARLAQVYGLYAAERMAGPRVWKDFPQYKRHIHPVRRIELERLWNHESSLEPT